MRYPNIDRKKPIKNRYAIYYYRIVGDFTKQDTSGSTNSLERAYGHAAGHCARSELNKGEYAQALVIDHKRGCIVRSYKKAANGGDIITKDF